MSHLAERILDKLVSGTASPADVQRILHHVGECRACARKLEEWRDNFAEVDERYPDLAIEMTPIATVTPGGLVLMPQEEEPRRRLDIDLSTLLWIGAVILALVVGYGASRLRQSSEGMVASRGPGDQAESGRETAAAPQVPAITPPAAALPHDTRSATTPPPARTEPASNPTLRPAVSTRAAVDTTPSRLAVSPRFKSVSRSEAVRRLGGPVRSLQGYDADHLEVGSASAVPGSRFRAATRGRRE